MGQRTRNKDKGGPVSTPAPTNDAPAPRDRDFGFAKQAYGANQWGGSSSVPAGQSVESNMATTLRAAQTGLDNVIRDGSRSEGPDVFQTHGDPGVFKNRGGKKTPGVAVGNRDANSGGAPSGAVPSKVGFNPGAVARTPGK